MTEPAAAGPVAHRSNPALQPRALAAEGAGDSPTGIPEEATPYAAQKQRKQPVWRLHRPSVIWMAVPVTTAPRTIDSPVTSLARVKPLDARRLAKLGIESVRDLLLTLPFDWELYGAPKRVAELRDGESATVVGTVAGSAAQITTRKRVRLTKATLRDDAGDLLRLVWFNQPYLARNLPPGTRLAVAGRVKGVNEGFEMLNPHHESLASVDESAGPRRIGGLMPKYH